MATDPTIADDHDRRRAQHEAWMTTRQRRGGRAQFGLGMLSAGAGVVFIALAVRVLVLATEDSSASETFLAGLLVLLALFSFGLGWIAIRGGRERMRGHGRRDHHVY